MEDSYVFPEGGVIKADSTLRHAIWDFGLALRINPKIGNKKNFSFYL